MAAARVMTAKKAFGHPSWRGAIRRQSLKRINMSSFRLRVDDGACRASHRRAADLLAEDLVAAGGLKLGAVLAVGRDVGIATDDRSIFISYLHQDRARKSWVLKLM